MPGGQDSDPVFAVFNHGTDLFQKIEKKIDKPDNGDQNDRDPQEISQTDGGGNNVLPGGLHIVFGKNRKILLVDDGETVFSGGFLRPQSQESCS